MLWSLTASADHMRRLYFRVVVAAHVDSRITTSDLVLDSNLGDGTTDDSLKDGGIVVSASSEPTAIVGYIIPKMPWRLSIEAVVGVPSSLKIEATGHLASDSLAPDADGVATGIPPLGRELAQAAMVAPIMSVIVRPVRLDRVTFLGGVGASTLVVYGEQVTNPVLTAVNSPRLMIPYSLGVVFQAGVETRVWRRFVLRLDTKYIRYGKQRATLDGIHVGTDIPLLPVVNVGSAHMNVTAQPIIMQCAIGADF